MTNDSAIWFFLSICAICFTWHKIATARPKVSEPPARELEFHYNGKPVNGAVELTVDGRSTRHNLVDGKIQ